ncbi:MAG: hypothetical protein IKE24_05390 [Clostridia bacterium]|nr:hypothetical protein [Clostridia bacterium]
MTNDFMDVCVFMNAVLQSESFGEAADCMRDLSGFFYYTSSFYSVSLYWRNQMLNAITDEVVYCVNGPDRSEARGLSICFGPDMTAEELYTYTENCDIPAYLAFLDAMYDNWQAPDWVYELVERPTEISEIPEYVYFVGRKIVSPLAFKRKTGLYT